MVYKTPPWLLYKIFRIIYIALNDEGWVFLGKDLNTATIPTLKLT